MKKLLLILFIATITGLATILQAPQRNELFILKGERIDPYFNLYEAVCIVESHRNSLAYNKTEGAAGIVQIRKIRLNDYNGRTGQNYTLKDCFDPKISKEIWYFYARQYGPYEFETIARRWNGRGHKTIKYWNLVKKHL